MIGCHVKNLSMVQTAFLHLTQLIAASLHSFASTLRGESPPTPALPPPRPCKRPCPPRPLQPKRPLPLQRPPARSRRWSNSIGVRRLAATRHPRTDTARRFRLILPTESASRLPARIEACQAAEHAFRRRAPPGPILAIAKAAARRCRRRSLVMERGLGDAVWGPPV
jgi:hypothetical protein